LHGLFAKVTPLALVTALVLFTILAASGCSLPSVLGGSAGTADVVVFSGAREEAQVSPGPAGSLPEPGSGPAGAASSVHIFVHVEGAVARPGVYMLLDGARACDALALAGGETSQACLAAVNLAAVLQDGQQLYVPTRDEVAAAGGGAGNGGQWAYPGGGQAAVGGARAGPLNVNLATAQALESLPGIGPVIAGRIVAYRETNGPFKAIEDLLKVSGIGPSRLADLKDRVVIR